MSQILDNSPRVFNSDSINVRIYGIFTQNPDCGLCLHHRDLNKLYEQIFSVSMRAGAKTVLKKCESLNSHLYPPVLNLHLCS